LALSWRKNEIKLSMPIQNENKYEDILKRYPKKRIDLSEEYKRIYKEHYFLNRAGTGFFNFLSQTMESWMHKKISKIQGNEILELGAGNLNHIKCENNFSNYDIVEPFKDLYEQSSSKSLLRNTYNSLDEINQKYDKIFSIATLEHLTNLPKEILLCKGLLKEDGVFQAAVPCEGEFAFKLGWKLTTSIAFRLKYNLDYSKLIKFEHVNSIEEIYTIIENNFKIVKFQRSPFILPIKHLSFYAYFECKLN